MELTSDKAFLQSQKVQSCIEKLVFFCIFIKNRDNFRAFHLKKSSLKIIVSYLQIHYNMVDSFKYRGDILVLLKLNVDTVDLISIGNNLDLCGEERRVAA